MCSIHDLSSGDILLLFAIGIGSFEIGKRGSGIILNLLFGRRRKN